MRSRTIEQVINQIFSPSGVFLCVEQAYIDAPVQINDLLAVRAKEFLPKAEVKVLSTKVFGGIQKVDDVNKRAKHIVDKYRAINGLSKMRRNSSFDASYLSDNGSKS